MHSRQPPHRPRPVAPPLRTGGSLRTCTGACARTAPRTRGALRIPTLAFVVPAALALLASPAPLAAQLGPRPPMPADTGGIGFHAVALATEARPAHGGAREREYYLTQPLLVIDDPGPRVHGRLMLDFEAWTLKDGELNAGTWGEGFVDRRHPHTFLHEVVLTAHATRGSLGVSLTGGRGFVPFGSDDPMTRPFVKYPANHHLAQILERWIGVAAVRVGPVALEAATFNGDEPDGPRSRGRRERIGDSYAGRVTLWPFHALELQASRALVESPEHPDGGGLDHRKWHASARLQAAPGDVPIYALWERGRTDEYDGDARAWSFATDLVEAAVALGRFRVAGRWERTSRPEEERLEDPFRTARPHADPSLLGVTRWRTVTLQLAGESTGAELTVTPFVEVSRLTAEEITGGVFDPLAFYGDDVQWSFSAGLRLSAGAGHGRVGRYGVALPAHGGGME